MRHTIAILALMFLLLPAPIAQADQALRVDWTKLKTVDDQAIQAGDATCVVVCFLGSECPLARLYGPRLNAMAERLKGRGVVFIGVNSNSQDSVEDVVRYASEHNVGFAMIKDSDQRLAKQFGATRTPEVFMLDADQKIRYRGRIDDQYQPGTARSKPTRQDLLEAIQAVVAGKPVARPTTQAVGCLITFLPGANTKSTTPTVTFTRDVAPILNRHCVECHREGEIGPFALTDYHEVVGWGRMMLEVIDDGRMPPWHADPRFGKFRDARRFPAEARRTLATWLQQGMPEGDPAALPPKPKPTAGWHLPTPPDEKITMRDRPFIVPVDGIVEYQYFVVDPQWSEDRWVRAAQVIPGDASVVHHSIVFVRPPDGARMSGIGWMGAYVPGQRVGALPPGHARRIPAGSKLIFQMHYTPNGKQTKDVTQVGVWFSKADEVTHEVSTRLAFNQHFEIEPGEANKVVQIRLDGFARGSRLLSAAPHMHLRGKSFRLEARRGSEAETLLNVPRYDFNWQHWYRFEDPLKLDEIDALEMRVAFDNSAENPVNPAPDEYVWWGDQTGEEMAVAFFDVAHPRGQPRILSGNNDKPFDKAAHDRRVEQRVDKFLADLDANSDGVVSEDEAPLSFRRFAFRRMDRNRDGQLDRSELKKAAARRP